MFRRFFYGGVIDEPSIRREYLGRIPRVYAFADLDTIRLTDLLQPECGGFSIQLRIDKVVTVRIYSGVDWIRAVG
jgi:hypothetical protein